MRMMIIHASQETQEGVIFGRRETPFLERGSFGATATEQHSVVLRRTSTTSYVGHSLPSFGLPFLSPADHTVHFKHVFAVICAHLGARLNQARRFEGHSSALLLVPLSLFFTSPPDDS